MAGAVKLGSAGLKVSRYLREGLANDEEIKDLVSTVLSNAPVTAHYSQ